MSTDKRGYLVMALHKQLGIGYKSAWYMLKRIQTAMMEKGWDYKLSGTVELDDAFFGAPEEGGKRGRGTNKAKVVVGLSLNKDGHPLFVKMEVTEDLTADFIGSFAKANVETGSTISSDAYISYEQLKNSGYDHQSKVFNSKEDSEHLMWLHVVVSNAKAFINGTFHGLDKKHL